MTSQLLTIVLAPLVAAAAAGLFGRRLGRSGAHGVTIAAVGLSFLLSAEVLLGFVRGTATVYDQNLYTWLAVGDLAFHVGFLVDPLTALMMTVVTFVSLMVHVYTIGYMHDDPGYQRFFAYISLFTFAMLMLVMANNFVQLFFGWEAVGLVSYLLIGFWYQRPSAIAANLKAFLVNRVGDFGFLLGIAAVLFYAGSLDYGAVFAAAPALAGQGMEAFGMPSWDVLTMICLLLFVGAMGKSAQAPLHVWLPDSMEGPTPISALIHAATMVTAGIFMVARMSPLFELSEAALSTVLVIGSLTAFFMGLIGIVQNDIKRVVAYSTLSQLGYMTAALGASAYDAAIFHLATHAFFKALLFLAAGSVIIALHHRQDLQAMGGLRRSMPITWLTAWVGTLALIGLPGFAGFYSKDAILIAVGHADRAGAGLASVLLTAGVFVTALYSVRLMMLAFHGAPRMDEETRSHVHESPWVVTGPLLLLAVPSLAAGWWMTGPLLFGDWLGGAIVQHGEPLAAMAEEWHGPLAFALHGFLTLPVWLTIAGAGLGVWLFLVDRSRAERLATVLKPAQRVLDRKYGFDELYLNVFARGGRGLGAGLWRAGDQLVIDGAVNGSAQLVGRLASVLRRLQTGYLFHYAFAMILGLIVLLGAFVLLA